MFSVLFLLANVLYFDAGPLHQQHAWSCFWVPHAPNLGSTCLVQFLVQAQLISALLRVMFKGLDFIPHDFDSDSPIWNKLDPQLNPEDFRRASSDSIIQLAIYYGPCHLDFKTTTFDDKNTSFQPTIVVTYISAFLVLNGHFIMF
jgi:hypothetical protein